jgi:hypothetical protein
MHLCEDFGLQAHVFVAPWEFPCKLEVDSEELNSVLMQSITEQSNRTYLMEQKSGQAPLLHPS